ncbi:MAG: sigma-70 family RNA polymerase sigma factor [Gammaproteobacteria bacterium]|nr:sigma-70 family RNA polymerase sigma factor [Gammaproteobacteria bacterium]
MNYHTLAEHIPSLRRYAIALLHDRSRADDLVQDTLERAMKKFSLFVKDSDLRAWLFTIMHNIFINQLSRRREIADTDGQTAQHPSAQNVAEEMIVARDIMNALQQLTDEQRSIILLIGLEQLSYDEAARVLKLPVGTVMSRLARARERLHALLNDEAGPQLRRVK